MGTRVGLVLFVSVLAGACATGRAPVTRVLIDPDAPLEPTGLAQVFRGPEGETASLVFVAPREAKRVLIRFDGTNTGWDGKVFLTIAHDQPYKADYITQIDGTDYAAVTMRDGAWEAHPPGRGHSIAMQYSDEDSRALDPAFVVAEYERQSGK